MEVKMSNMLSLIKQAAVEAVSEGLPMAVLFGIVEAVDPQLIVKVEDRIKLEEKQLLLWEGTGTLDVGDVLFLFRVQGGEKYLILGRVQ
jgi:hypothetical protein